MVASRIADAVPGATTFPFRFEADRVLTSNAVQASIAATRI
jgi:hypothetical protein